MTIKEVYEKVGNYQEVTQRFGKETLVIRFALKFKNDNSYKILKDAIKNGDLKEIFNAAHTLKGVAGNVGFTKLHEASSKLTEQLRPLTEPVNIELVNRVDEAYDEVISTLEKLQV